MSELLNNGIELMKLGMGMVFVFLVLLIFCTKLMSAVVRKFPGEEASDLGTAKPVAIQTNELAQVAAVAAAVRAFQNKS